MSTEYEKQLEKRVEELETTIKCLESGTSIKNEMLSLTCDGWRLIGLHGKRFKAWNNTDETRVFSFILEKTVNGFFSIKKYKREYQFDISDDSGYRLDTPDGCSESEVQILKKIFIQLRNAGFLEQVATGSKASDTTFRISDKWKNNFQ